MNINPQTGLISGTVPQTHQVRPLFSYGFRHERRINISTFDLTLLSNEVNFLDPSFIGNFEVSEDIQPVIKIIDPDGHSNGYTSFQWYSTLDPTSNMKTVLGPGNDGIFKLNAEQFGHYIGFQASFIDDSGNFEQSEIFWSSETVGGDESLNTSAQFDGQINGDLIVGSTLEADLTILDPDGHSNGYTGFTWYSTSDPNPHDDIVTNPQSIEATITGASAQSLGSSNDLGMLVINGKVPPDLELTLNTLILQKPDGNLVSSGPSSNIKTAENGDFTAFAYYNTGDKLGEWFVMGVEYTDKSGSTIEHQFTLLLA